jgi:AcrR family transcriptional regulator
VKQPKFQRRAEDRPTEICAAALEVFAEKGFAAAKLDEIAKRAGVSKGTLYLYFQDKADLFRAVIRDTVAPRVAAVRELAEKIELPFAQIVPLFFANFAEMTARLPVGAVAKIVIGESRNFPDLAKIWHDQVASGALSALEALIERAQDRGEVRPGDARLMAFSLMGPMLMGVLWKATLEPAGGQPLDMAKLAAQHGETVLAGMLTEKAR